MLPNEAYILVVEDDPELGPAMVDALSEIMPTVLRRTARGAERVLDTPDVVAAVIIKPDLPDGHGLDLIESLGKKRPLMPVLVLSNRAKWSDVNRAFRVGARFLRRELEVKQTVGDVEEFIESVLPGANRLTRMVTKLAQTSGLTTRQTEILMLALQGCSRDNLAETMGVSINTVKTHVRHILKRCQADSLDDVCGNLMRAALQNSAA